MQELHPADAEMKDAVIWVILAVVLLLVSVYFGVWDKFLEVTVTYFPLWHWGG